MFGQPGDVCALYRPLDNVTHSLLDLNSLSGPEYISYSILTGMETCEEFKILQYCSIRWIFFSF